MKVPQDASEAEAIYESKIQIFSGVTYHILRFLRMHQKQSTRVQNANFPGVACYSEVSQNAPETI